ncbi:hypothetical protein MPH_12016 [Macrophomina phaseolina MS6]|uniref:Zn(2)-C6 fungal-type domain-containing protein n=1 Tax=Macrophomina phaseolina (strain MS6) TaxID=1126212 RepID=K2R993_MACPH|nr:hypothetical protein MPH_12016 [Macrophomina phaseolina MS6]
MADRTQPRRRGYRRNYQACEACKKQKGRCDLGSPDNPKPPCTRCRRARKECVFGPSRFSSRGNGSNSTSPAAHSSGSSHAAPPTIPSFPNVSDPAAGYWMPQGAQHARDSSANVTVAVLPESHALSSSSKSNADAVTSQPSSRDEGHLRDELMNASIRNPTDAMGLLSHTARYGTEEYLNPFARRDKRPIDDGDSYGSNISYGPDIRSRFPANEYPETPEDNPRGDDLTFSTWMHFRMCKDRVICPNEALFLIN